MREKLSEHQHWNTINADSDCILLLTLLRNIAHNTEEQTNPNLALIQATQRLYSLKQKNNQTLDDYKIKFDNMLAVITSMGGCVSQPKHLEYASKRDYQTNYHNLTPDQQSDVAAKAEERARALLFIQNSNGKQYYQFKNELHNRYLSGRGKNEVYPATMAEANQRLLQHRPIRLDSGNTSGPIDNARSFATKGSTPKSSRKKGGKTTGSVSSGGSTSSASIDDKWKNHVCAVCGEKGHGPHPKYCQLVRALTKSDELTKKAREVAAKSNSSVGSTSQKPSRKQRSGKSKSKPKTSARKKAAVKDFQKQQQKQFVQFMNYMNDYDSDTSSGSNSSATSSDHNSGYGFAQIAVPASNHRSGGSHRSGKNSRSGRVSRQSSSDDSEGSVTQSDPDTDMDDYFPQPWMEVKRKKKRISSRRK